MLITFWNGPKDQCGKQRDITWEKLAEWLTRPVEFSGDTTPGWSAGWFIGSRRLAKRCMAMSALVLDFDDGNASRDALEALFGQRKALVHTSKSHTAENYSYRVILALSRDVTKREYELLWQAVTRPFLSLPDPATKDCSRYWYGPCVLPTTEYATFAFTGQPLDVDAIVEAEEAREAAIAAAAKARPTRQYSTEGRMSVEERASRYVSKMDASISGSHGHDALWAATVALVRGFELSRDEAYAILWSEFNPRCQPQWSAKEINHKLDCAEKAKLEPGYLLGDAPGYEYRTEAPVIPPCPIKAPEPMSLNDPDGIEVQPEPEAPPEPQSAFERLGIVSIQSLCLDVLTDVNKPKTKAACKTGIHELDTLTGGLRPGMVTVLGAPTNFGKTTFSIMVADLAAKNDRMVLYVSAEDAGLLYGRRIVSRRSGVNALRLRDGDVSQDERRAIMQVAQNAQKEPFFLDAIGRSAEWIAKAMLDVSQERKIDLVVVDYLQRVRTEKRTQDRRNEVTFAAETLTNTIKRIGASGLLLSQLRRLQPGERPSKGDLKESGDIENMAEHIILGFTKENNGAIERMAILDKNKDGPVMTGEISLRFDNKSAAFISDSEFGIGPEYDVDDLDRVIGG